MENVSDFSLPDSYKVTRIKDESAAKPLQQKATDFIQSRLYGPGTKRTTSKLMRCAVQIFLFTRSCRPTEYSKYLCVYLSSDAELLSLEKKRAASQGAAVEFANKKLGE